MSTTFDPDQPLDIREQIARIDRAIAETHKLQQESDKFVAEQKKLIAEAGKLDRDRTLSPWLLGASLLGGLVVAAANHFWH